MRLATWNVNGVRARLDLLLLWLKDRRPDLAALQELKAEEAQFPRAEIEAAGYRAAVLGQKGWNGVAVLSREEVKVTERGLPGQEDFGARLLTVEMGDLSFTTVYIPNGKDPAHEDFPRKLAWLDALLAHFRERCRPEEDVIVAGDFNVCPSPIDSWNEAALRGTIFHTDAERARFRGLLDWGFRDLFREKNPGLRAFSWWDYRGGAFHQGQGLRIDLLLGTAGVLSRVRSATIDRDYRKKKEALTPSDHAPVIVEID